MTYGNATTWQTVIDSIADMDTALEVCEAPVHGIRYHCVEIKGWGLEWHNMESWCRSTFGEPGELWPQDNFIWPEAARWLMNNRKFWFRNEADRTLFLLKWST